MSKNMQLDKTVKEYILNSIDGENYNIELKTDKDKLAFLYSTFSKEYDWAIKRNGQYLAFTEWIMGLPSSFNIDFENYKILKLAKEWQSIPEDATEKQEDIILSKWFNFITVKTFQLFKKYKVA